MVIAFLVSWHWIYNTFLIFFLLYATEMVNILGGLELLFNPYSESKTTGEPLYENHISQFISDYLSLINLINIEKFLFSID